MTALLDRSARRHDEVVVVAFRGASASVVLEPTQDLDAAQSALAYLPTGGRTPLAHGLELAAGYITDATVLILLTDGRGNVPSRGDDAWEDAVSAAGAIRCPSLVIDSEATSPRVGRARELADVMRATCVALEDLDDTQVLRLLRASNDASWHPNRRRPDSALQASSRSRRSASREGGSGAKIEPRAPL